MRTTRLAASVHVKQSERWTTHSTSNPSRRGQIRGLAALVLTLAARTTPGTVKGQATYTLLTGGVANIPAGAGIQSPISEDGSKLYFSTTESLSPLDTDSARDIYLAENGAITLISGGTANLPATIKRMTRDGSRVFFVTTESLDSADVDTAQDVYAASGGTITLITGGVANIDADLPIGIGDRHTERRYLGFSDDGSTVFFETAEAIPGTGDGDALSDIYQNAGGVITLLTPGTSTFTSFQSNSADAAIVYFITNDPLDAGDLDTTSDLYRVSGGVYRMISPTGTSVALNSGFNFVQASANGSYVIFNTSERVLPGPGQDEDGVGDCYRWSAATGNYDLVTGRSLYPNAADIYANECTEMSPDGSRVYINATQDLSGGDTNQMSDVYLWSGGTLTLVTSGSPGIFSGLLAASADGSKLVIGTNGSFVPSDTDSLGDQYLLSGGTYTLLTPGTTQLHLVQSLSLDLARLYFITLQAIDAADTDAQYDVYEGSTAGLRLLTPGTNAGASFGAASNDGQRVFIVSTEVLSADDVDTAQDYYDVSIAPADVEPPVVALSISAADAVAGSGWYNIASSGTDGVTVNVAATDPSGITAIVATDFAATVLNTSSANGSFALTDSLHSISAFASDGVGNTGATTGSSAMPVLVQVDQAAPAIACTNPTVLLNASGPVGIANVTDATSGPVATSLSITPNTSTVGLKTAPVTGVDVAGNQTTQSCGYRVVYAFTGYGAPLSVPPNDYVVASVNKNIPMPFVLRDAQNAPVLGLNPKAVVETGFVNGSLCVGTPTTLQASAYPKGKSGLVEIGGGGYEYRFKAAKSAAGQCHRVSLNFGDGIQYLVVFRLTP